MRTTTMCLAAAVLLTFMAIGAPADDAKSDGQRLQESKAKWSKVQEDCGGNYRYFISHSNFVGAGNETEVVVRGGKVAGRRYREFGPIPAAPPPPGEEPPKIEYKWVEQGDKVGSHKEGAPAETLDELYARAEKVAAAELEPTQKRYVRFDQQGLLMSCYYVDTRIADDAPTTGVIVSSIKIEKPAP
ncbi:MAG: hypothetical protein KDA41_21455 [Planctomycetales bacterium]|nr:hypothetical protein [Planctomycetales bacterium]